MKETASAKASFLASILKAGEHYARITQWRLSEQKRRARARMAGGILSRDILTRLYRLQRGKCACCGLPLGSRYELDHISPLAKGGQHSDNNMQLLRKRCNQEKSAKHPVDFMRSRGFLL